jgi:predicted aminopeptidase
MRPVESIPLTLEEHRELGAELRKSRTRIQELRNVVSEVYGPNNQAAFSFSKAAEALERLRVDLQTQAARDWPGFHTDGIYT